VDGRKVAVEYRPTEYLKENPMSGFQWKATNSIGAIVSVALMLQDLAIAQSQTTTTQIDKPNRVSVAYVATKDLVLQEFYGRLKNQMP
jgi:hypothetical protein